MCFGTGPTLCTGWPLLPKKYCQWTIFPVKSIFVTKVLDFCIRNGNRYYHFVIITSTIFIFYPIFFLLFEKKINRLRIKLLNCSLSLSLSLVFYHHEGDIKQLSSLSSLGKVLIKNRLLLFYDMPKSSFKLKRWHML